MKKTAVLLVNLGTPDEPTEAAVRRYLKEFLSDQRVVEAPKLIWWPVLNGIILRTRPKRVAEAYQSIWQEDSPLRLVSQDLVKALSAKLESVTIDYAMTYGKPALMAKLDELAQTHQRIIVLPLFPQYSGSTTAALNDLCVKWQLKQRNLPELSVIRDYHDHDAYVAALAESVEQHWQTHEKADLLMMSFHGIPQEYAKKGDPYPEECKKTAELVAQKLGLDKDQWMMTFQSRFGPKKWLQPYTDKTLEKIAKKQGVRSIQVMCPGFAADCLETLEEINIENRGIFLENGGERFEYISALNAQSFAVDAYQQLIQTYLI